MRKILFLPVIALLNISVVHSAQPKHVAVAPENMSKQQLTSPESKGVLSHSTMIPVKTSGPNSSNQEVSKNIYFDGKADNPLLFLSPNAENWNITATSASGHSLVNERANASQALEVQEFQIGEQKFKGKSILFPAASEGMWQIKLSKKNELTSEANIQATDSSTKVEGYLMFKGDKQFKLYSHLDSNFTTKDSDINIVAYMVDSQNITHKSNKPNRKQALKRSINKAFVEIITPSNKRISLLLKDDGTKGDRLAGDGLYSAKLPTDEVGTYTSQVQVEGVRPDGVRFSRTVTDLYPVEIASFRVLDRFAELKQINSTTSLVSIPVVQMQKSSPMYVSAEIWGTSKRGVKKPSVWIGGLASPRIVDDQVSFELSVNNRWLKRNGIQAPYSLKSIRIQNGTTNTPIDEKKELALIQTTNLNSLSAINASPTANSNAILPEMLTGNSPSNFSLQSYTSGSGSKLLLVHGYCSGKVWNTGDFTNSAEFQDYDQNRSHDDFAQRIISFGSPYNSYGIVAHSQGGAAALHMYSRYWTGLDNATGGQLIQSVGTPYQGTALAGNLALLGEVFGVGCGVNTDLTYSGAANWLATIPSWARAKVDYYTTSFTDKWWRYDYCHLATDLFLDDPEDGTTEKWAGQLSGGVNKGHKTGWCHTNGMRDTAQFKDSSRNSSMNSRAAR